MNLMLAKYIQQDINWLRDHHIFVTKIIVQPSYMEHVKKRTGSSNVDTLFNYPLEVREMKEPYRLEIDLRYRQ